MKLKLAENSQWLNLNKFYFTNKTSLFDCLAKRLADCFIILLIN